MDRRFAALRVIGSIFKVLGWIGLILGVLLALAALVLGFTVQDAFGLIDLTRGGPLVGLAGFVVILTLSIVSFLALYGFGEFLFVFLSIEESARRTAYILQMEYAPPPRDDLPLDEGR